LHIFKGNIPTPRFLIPLYSILIFSRRHFAVKFDLKVVDTVAVVKSLLYSRIFTLAVIQHAVVEISKEL